MIKWVKLQAAPTDQPKLQAIARLQVITSRKRCWKFPTNFLASKIQFQNLFSRRKNNIEKCWDWIKIWGTLLYQSACNKFRDVHALWDLAVASGPAERHLFGTDFAPADPLSACVAFESLWYWSPELVVDGRQPETEFVRKVVTRSSRSIALDEGRGTEVLQARARTRQGLTPALCARTSVLKHKGQRG